MSKSFQASEVAEHKKLDSLWIIVEGDVYDVTKVYPAFSPFSPDMRIDDSRTVPK
jgi:cytochrome b involved in lipid metabolism